MEKLTDKLFTVKYNEDTGHPHIEIVNQDVCRDDCEGKYCNHFCPAGVYEYDYEQKRNLVSFGNCLECGACAIGCPYNNVGRLRRDDESSNIRCHAPRGGYGASYRFG